MRHFRPQYYEEMRGFIMAKLAISGGEAVLKGLGQWPIVTQAEVDAVSECVRTGRLYRCEGDQVDKFEEVYRNYIGTDYALAVTNGTASLELALAAAGIGPGDEVIVPGYTFYSSASAVSFVGATPVFCDVDLDTCTLDRCV